ncbi:bifunctional Delta(1)-pyrroline-2-carboxylate/Delta(1)-piperideine-2-carboxylate reductase [Paraburkholderia phosphatilytica]|uniref:bifunctional Delta(1)-pyrroline-2-carboxylate/Delta(1)-piperideine-2- carboxylate reductase n=1 Tax=Paraburkholderia phosphatilytica TaxID=2282883 RepID=UPI000E4F2C56|nr:bifunctional Delta(1)-pyrroline-2-carboxylate/Delta(1)-piperideine-2-carboxylate reductase [Paraburkholderia phosphatilytica]
MTRTAQIFDAHETAHLTPYPALVDALKTAATDYAQARIASPERLVVPLNEGGMLLSMPAAASDLAIHKLVNVCPTNRERNLPTIHGQVTACDAHTGEALFVLDGPTVTGRRTAAMTMLGIALLHRATPRDFLLIGTGTQAANHVEAIAALYPDATVRVRGSSPSRAEAFCASHAATHTRLVPLPDTTTPDSVDVVIALTTSRQPVYDEAPRADRLVIGVGAFMPAMIEIGARTVAGSVLYVDDKAGAKHEAGDYIQAGVDWARVTGIAALVDGSAAPRAANEAAVFKTVGCAAWDLAACRVAAKGV